MTENTNHGAHPVEKPATFSITARDGILAVLMLVSGAGVGGGATFFGGGGVREDVTALRAEVKDLTTTVQASLRKGDETAGSLNFLRERIEENRRKIDDVEKRLLFLERGR